MAATDADGTEEWAGGWYVFHSNDHPPRPAENGDADVYEVTRQLIESELRAYLPRLPRRTTDRSTPRRRRALPSAEANGEVLH